jgi:hypothetical protein
MAENSLIFLAAGAADCGDARFQRAALLKGIDVARRHWLLVNLPRRLNAPQS